MTHEHIDHLLREWEYEPYSICVREIQGSDGRDLLQMRIDMGIMQLETEGRPDGERPNGYETYFDYLQSEIMRQGEDFELDEEQCSEVDREFVQFYHRRVCWLRLQGYEKAQSDAEHTLGLMDLCKEFSPDEQWIMSHEQYRPFVMFHRTQAAALSKLDEKDGPELAINAINVGLQQLRDVFEEYDAEEQYEDDELVSRLLDLRETLRQEYRVGRTLHEELKEAVANENYERAAQIRDQLERQED